MRGLIIDYSAHEIFVGVVSCLSAIGGYFIQLLVLWRHVFCPLSGGQRLSVSWRLNTMAESIGGMLPVRCMEAGADLGGVHRVQVHPPKPSRKINFYSRLRSICAHPFVANSCQWRSPRYLFYIHPLFSPLPPPPPEWLRAMHKFKC